MTERSYPFVDGPTTDAEFSAMFRRIFPSSVDGFYGSDALAATADMSGLRVKLQPGTGFVRGHLYRNSEQLSLPVTPNTTGQARVDTLILRLEYGSVKRILARIKPGAAGLGAPALEQTETGVFEMPLWDIGVAAGAATIGPQNLTDRRKWWGLELMRSMGFTSGPTLPDADETFLHVKTL